MTIKVSDLYVYPLKSAAGNAVDYINITDRGPENDRMWMLVQREGSKAGQFITQRTRGCEKLALVKALPQPNGHSIIFEAPEKEPLFIDHDTLQPSGSPVTVWSDQCKALWAEPDVNEWFSDYLGIACALVRMPGDFNRYTDPVFSAEGDTTGFADGFQFLITSKSSLDALKNHFPGNVDIRMSRFRPNIVLEGTEPFEEDVIHTLKINGAVLEIVKPCYRCQIPTIEQETGLVLSKEPSATLARMRKGKGDGLQGVFFGQNANARSPGIIAAGDTVEVVSRRDMHPALAQCALKFSV